MIPVLVLVFYLPYTWTNFASAAVFGLAAITDWLDGWVARRYQIHRIRLPRTQGLLHIFEQAGIEDIASHDGDRRQWHCRSAGIRRIHFFGIHRRGLAESEEIELCR